MALNPLIRSISSQKAAPDEHIHRFLHSMSPYVQQHAQFGQKSFERDVIGAGTEGKGQLTSSSQEKGTEWMPTGKELRARLERRSGREGKAKEEAEGSKSWELIAGCYPPSGMEIHKKRQSSHEYLDYQHHSRPAPNLQGVRESRIRPDDPKDFGVESLAPNTNPQPAREPESRGASPQNLGTQRERLKESYVEETETAIRMCRELILIDRAHIL